VTKPRTCIDCAPGVKRKAPHPGPRCATHHRARRQATTKATHEAYVQRTYGLGPGDYDRLKEAQGGRCFICQRATGATRRLAVDHSHDTGLARGLLCKPCNRMLGHARDSVEFFERAIDYLNSPPAARLGITAIHIDNRKDVSDA
jgi:hypothetical protein